MTTSSTAQTDSCTDRNCDCDEFAPVVIGHVSDRGYSERWEFLSPDGEPSQLFIWENGQDVSGDGAIDLGISFDEVRSMVVDDVVPDLLAEGYKLITHEGPVDDYNTKLAAAWAAVNNADEDEDIEG